MSLKRKVISVATALTIGATIAPSVYALDSGNYTVRTDYTRGEKYYKDKYSNKVYDYYVIDKNGDYTTDVYFDSNRNALVGIYKKGSYYYDQYNHRITTSYVYDFNDSRIKLSSLFDSYGERKDYRNNYNNNYNNYNNYNYRNSYYYDNNGQLRNSETGSVVYYYYDRNGNMIDSTNGNIINVENNYNYNNNYNNNYSNYYGNDEVNIDISDPEVLERHLQYRNGELYYGNTHVNNHNAEFNNNFNNGYNGYENYNPNYDYGNVARGDVYTANVLYTLVKTQYGKTVYAYSPVANVEQFGLYGWTLNSVYNSNDFELNSVFYEEINSFWNDFRYDFNTVNKINNINNLFIWSYYTPEGTKYCVSTTMMPAENSGFTYNSKFNINDVNVDLKTASAVANGYTRIYR